MFFHRNLISVIMHLERVCQNVHVIPLLFAAQVAKPTRSTAL